MPFHKECLNHVLCIDIKTKSYFPFNCSSCKILNDNNIREDIKKLKNDLKDIGKLDEKFEWLTEFNKFFYLSKAPRKPSKNIRCETDEQNSSKHKVKKKKKVSHNSRSGEVPLIPKDNLKTIDSVNSVTNRQNEVKSKQLMPRSLVQNNENAHGLNPTPITLGSDHLFINTTTPKKLSAQKPLVESSSGHSLNSHNVLMMIPSKRNCSGIKSNHSKTIATPIYGVPSESSSALQLCSQEMNDFNMCSTRALSYNNKYKIYPIKFTSSNIPAALITNGHSVDFNSPPGQNTSFDRANTNNSCQSRLVSASHNSLHLQPANVANPEQSSNPVNIQSTGILSTENHGENSHKSVSRDTEIVLPVPPNSESLKRKNSTCLISNNSSDMNDVVTNITQLDEKRSYVDTNNSPECSSLQLTDKYLANGHDNVKTNNQEIPTIKIKRLEREKRKDIKTYIKNFLEIYKTILELSPRSANKIKDIINQDRAFVTPLLNKSSQTTALSQKEVKSTQTDNLINQTKEIPFATSNSDNHFKPIKQPSIQDYNHIAKLDHISKIPKLSDTSEKTGNVTTEVSETTDTLKLIDSGVLQKSG